jgi:FkbM family methyltransferase
MMNYITNFDAFPKGTEIYIYGAGGAGKELFEHVVGSGWVIAKGFIDTYKNGEFLGLPIFKFEDFKTMTGAGEAIIVIASAYENEIAWQLEDAGIASFHAFRNMDRFVLCSLMDELLPADEKYSLLDVGARNPLKTTFWLPLQGERLEIFGFDADAQESARINQEAKITGLNYTCYPIALWSETGRLTFYHTPELSENSSFYPHNFDIINRWKVQHRYGQYTMGQAMQKVEAIEMAVDTLDNWKRDNDIGSIDFAKLNIEGAELPALQGGKSVMAGLLGIMAEASMVDFNRPMFSELDAFIRSQGFEFFDFWVSNAIGRHASPLSILSRPRITYKQGQVIQTYPVYFRDPIRMQQQGRDLGMFNRMRLLKLVGLAEMFMQIEFALELLNWTADFLEVRGEVVADLRQTFDEAIGRYERQFA